jgi:predicted phage-related endonuclease
MDRLGFLGSSDAPILCGYSKLKSPYKLWLEKKGFQFEDFDFRMLREVGNYLEPLLLKTLSEKMGLPVYGQQKEVVHPAHSFIRVHIDGLFSEDENIEAKTGAFGAIFPDGWGEEGSGDIPDGYILQAACQQECGGYARTHVPVLLRGTFRHYIVERDRELGEMVIHKMAAFWKSLEDDIPPEIRTPSDVLLRYPKGTGTVIAADREVRLLLEDLRKTRGFLEQLEERKTNLEVEIKKFMGEADVLTEDGKRAATWKSDKNGRRTFRLN